MTSKWWVNLADVRAQHSFDRHLYLARIRRPDFFDGRVSALARVVTKWNGACGKRMARLTGYPACTSDLSTVCHVGKRVNECKPGLFQDAKVSG